MNKVKEAELKLKSDEMKMNQEDVEKYRVQMAEINTKISELKVDQEEIKKSKI